MLAAGAAFCTGFGLILFNPAFPEAPRAAHWHCHPGSVLGPGAVNAEQGWGPRPWCPKGSLSAVPVGDGEQPAEGSTEVPVEEGVDEGVDAAVAVADPEEEVEEGLGDVTALPTESP